LTQFVIFIDKCEALSKYCAGDAACLAVRGFTVG